jgi:hypothetical protein
LQAQISIGLKRVEQTIRFRLRASGLHLIASTVVLTLVLGSFYFGWYRWPGWYLADALHVVAALAGVDLALGPLLTLVVARSSKPRRELTRDIAIIVVIQLLALSYGATTLWKGRPLYYAYSEGFLQLVQAYDINGQQQRLARKQNPELAPHCYSLPRWIWAPLPKDPDERNKIVKSAVAGGDDVISMPAYFKPWEQGLPELREQLKRVDELAYFSGAEKKVLTQRMRAAGFATDRNSMVFTGRGRPLLAIFDPASLKIDAIIKAN